MDQPVVAVVHPGQMGAAVGLQMVRAGAEVLWCPTGRSQLSAARARDAGLRPVTWDSLVRRARAIVSVCPTAVAELVADEIVAAGFCGLFVDLNSISPVRMENIAARVTAGGGRCIDGCLVGPPPSLGTTRTRLHLAGDLDDTAEVAKLFSGTAVEVLPTADRIGAASALKTAQNSYTMASRALETLAFALAERYGVGDALQAEARRTEVPQGSSREVTDYDQLKAVTEQARRWVPELAEAAGAMRRVGLPDEMIRGAADIFAALADDDFAPSSSPMPGDDKPSDTY